MTQIDYRLIINDFDEQSFNECVHLLYKHLNYKVLTESDIRPVDLLEKLADYQKENMMYYAKDVMTLLDNVFTHNPRTENYYQKAKRDAEKLIKDGNDIDVAEDLAKIFICFVRCYCAPMEQNNPDMFKFEIREDDFKTLNVLMENKFYIKDKRKDVLGQKVGKKPNQISETVIKFVYVVSILFWCRLNQFEGIDTDAEVE